MNKKISIGLLVAATAVAWNCSEESTTSVASSSPLMSSYSEDINCLTLVAEGASAWIVKSSPVFLIYAPDAQGNFVVRLANGNLFGSYNAEDQTIFSTQNKAILTGIDINDLAVIDQNCDAFDPTTGTAYPHLGELDSLALDSVLAISSASPVPQSSVSVLVSSSSLQSLSSAVALSSAAAPASSSRATVSSSSKIASSSSAPKSSSSVASSSSKKDYTNNITDGKAPDPNIKVVNGGASGSGKATRYWDSCAPSCAWTGKKKESYVDVAKTCLADGTEGDVKYDGSVCNSDGLSGTCTFQAPMIINDKYAYAFAAANDQEAVCGRCFMLTFNGGAEGGDRGSIRDKKLIVMISNTGSDVQRGNFDIMIPGGGVGQFDGCRKMGISCNGQRYGGLLSDCGNGNKDCLAQKCNSEYKDPNLRNGCLFLANWLDAADNPYHSYKQVECPQELIDRF
ncbi:MAG: hypothetical protein HUK21_05400 [Fibrobacteraceae bacterium]|nr:hypothetical protein [Fibrobacteraceae bacterium]